MLRCLVMKLEIKFLNRKKHITSAESSGEMKYGDKEVANAITEFLETWMGSKVEVEQRWSSPGESEEETWS